jgi:hypothetical protein
MLFASSSEEGARHGGTGSVWINGCVVARIVDKKGKVKRRALAGRGLKKLLVWLRLRSEPELLMEQRFYQVVSRDWGYLMGDLLVNSEQYVQVGDGGKEQVGLRCKRAAGERRVDEGYPEWDWGRDWETGAEKGIIVYTATFPAGAVKTKRINEVGICAGNGAGLVYGRLGPGVEIRRGDRLQIRVELTCAVPIEIGGEG